MSQESLSQKIYRWQSNCPEKPSPFDGIHSFILFRAKHSYNEYEPTKTSSSLSYEKRLYNWICNVRDDNAQQLLFNFAPNLFFVGQEEFISLNISAMEENIVPWLIDVNKIDIFSDDLSAELDKAKKRTWFCPITDSMDISRFCHIHNLAGNNLRPNWHSLSVLLEDKKKIIDYIAQESIEQIVLLEDFIASGGQVLGLDADRKGAIPFLCELLNENPTLRINALIVPLIVSEKGFNNIVEYIKKVPTIFDRIQVKPTLVLPKSLFLDIRTGENADLYDLIQSIDSSNGYLFTYGPLGYRGTGSTVVMYTNCPDNTISLVHEELSNWKPLFPRVSREKIS